MRGRVLAIVTVLGAGVAGQLTAAASAQCLPTWHLPTPGPWINDEVFALATWDPDGSGPQPPVVVAGGNSSWPSTGVAIWDGLAWQAMGSGMNGTGLASTVFDPDGPGPLLPGAVIGGSFTMIGGIPANRVAWWDGVGWNALGEGLGLWAGSHVDTFAVFNGDLIAGGIFNLASGGEVGGIARWDGLTWLPMHSTEVSGPHALHVHAGTLYAGGLFSHPQGTGGMARWTGTAWTTVGTNYPRGPVEALTSFRGELIAGGDFLPPASPGIYIARFDGVTWGPLGAGLSGPVLTLTVWDPDGPGPRPEVLIAGGNFTHAGSVQAVGIAAWDGQEWSALGSGLNLPARALTVWQDQLIVGGPFTTAGGRASPYFARYGCPAPCYADCNKDGVLNLADFGCFQTMFSIGDPYADCNGDGVRNIADFGCFMTKFAVGCP